MNRPRRGRARRPVTPEARPIPRTARLAQLLREIVAEELRRIDDEHLELVTITAVEVDAELNRAIVYFDSLRGPSGDAEVLEALAGHRVRFQATIARQIRARKTPVLHFRPDEVIRSAERIEEILRANPPSTAEAAGESFVGGEDDAGRGNVDGGHG